jgi:hypothetical protein
LQPDRKPVRFDFFEFIIIFMGVYYQRCKQLSTYKNYEKIIRTNPRNNVVRFGIKRSGTAGTAYYADVFKV